MENQLGNGSQNVQQVEQNQKNPTGSPAVLMGEPKKNYFLIVGEALICFAAFGLGGYYLGKQSSNCRQSMDSPLILPSPTLQALTPNGPTAKPSADLTTDWETYVGKSYSFKHPKGLEFDTEAAGAGAESVRFQFIGAKQRESGRTQTELFDGYSFVVTKLGSVSQKTPIQWASERRESEKDICGPDVLLSEVEQITIDKGVGVQYTVKNCMGDYTTSYVAYDDNVYEITQLYSGEGTDRSNYEEITNEIFNTLRFF